MINKLLNLQLPERIPVFFIALLFIPSILFAQADLSLWGQVSDSETGLPISGAIVQLHPTSERAITDQNGEYGFFNLRHKDVSISVSADGYNGTEFREINLQEGISSRFDAKLKAKIYHDPDQYVLGEKEKAHAGKVVINCDSPEFANAKNLGDILEFVPGVMLAESGGSNQSSTISIGGAPAKQTGVYVDGMPLNSKLTGEFDINTIPRQAVEKIEVYTSGAGSKFGAGPLAGAINIITRKAVIDGESSFEQFTGSFNSNNTNLTIQNKIHDKLSGLLILSRNTASNDFRYDDPKLGGVGRENNYRDINNRYLNLDYNLSDSRELYLSFSETQSIAGLPGAVYALTPAANKSEMLRIWNTGANLRLSRALNLKASVQHSLSHQRFSDYESFFPYDSKYRDSRLGILVRPEYLINRNHMISARVNVNFDRFRQMNLIDTGSSNIDIRENRIQSGINYEGHFDIKPSYLFFDYLDLKLAGTQTSSELFRPLFSPLVRVDLEKGRERKFLIFASYGNSYRAPTYASLFWSEDAFSVGNPDLKPEKSEDFGLGTHYIFSWGGRWDLGLEYEHSYIKDLIYWERRYDGKYMPYNLPAARVSTVRWNADWELMQGLGRISINYSLSDPRDRSWESNVHDMLLTFRPRKILDFKFRINPEFFFLSCQTRWVSERYIRRANTKFLDSYTVSDLSGGIKRDIGRFEVSVSAEINNVFSEEYEIIERYPLPGRSYGLHVGLSYKYNSGGHDED
jgi:outer membrane cobalamin receptor